jgi:hypothetical protein
MMEMTRRKYIKKRNLTRVCEKKKLASDWNLDDLQKQKEFLQMVQQIQKLQQMKKEEKKKKKVY